MFEKGQSGNPTGRKPETTMSREIKRLAQSNCPEAIKKLVEWMRSDNPKASVAASNAILDRGLGKPMQSLEIDSTIRHTTELSDADLADIAAGRRNRVAETPSSEKESPELH